ncbi:MAG: GTP 3',8-cyclase MoaA [Nitrospirota bacterium]
MVLDPFNRPIRDLRISVTDRCNFRCVYCMPKEVFGRDYVFLPREKILRFEEIARLTKIFVSLGVKKVRVTGGEPLLRREIHHLITLLAQIPDLDITLTTNGALLAEQVRLLKEAGLQRITVSLDALDDKIFQAMNDVDFPVRRVLDGINAAAEAGFTPIKINVVLKRGMNDQEILPMARYFRGSGHILRFIEYMDVGDCNGWRLNDVVPAREVIKTIHAKMPIEPVGKQYQGEVANRWRYCDGSGEIGVITSVTQPFCGDCSRSRLSADGRLFTCLFATEGHDLLTSLRAGASDEQIAEIISGVWRNRTDRYSEIRSAKTQNLPKVEMSYLGG